MPYLIAISVIALGGFGFWKWTASDRSSKEKQKRVMAIYYDAYYAEQKKIIIEKAKADAQKDGTPVEKGDNNSKSTSKTTRFCEKCGSRGIRHKRNCPSLIKPNLIQSLWNKTTTKN
jgi:hypothetical protein